MGTAGESTRESCLRLLRYPWRSRRRSGPLRGITFRVPFPVKRTVQEETDRHPDVGPETRQMSGSGLPATVYNGRSVDDLPRL